jgi:small-conductance mechanosensitive channel/uncharacterized membrane protein YgcG
MTRLRCALCGLLMTIGLGTLAAAPPDGTSASTAPSTTSALPLPPKQVVTFVSDSIAWYRRVMTLQQLPIDSDDVVPSDRLYQGALTTVQLAFDFGRAAGALAGPAPQPPASGQPPKSALADGSGGQAGAGAQGQAATLDAAAARLAERISALQGQLKSLDEQIAHASAKDKETLTAQRGEVSAALDFTKEVQGTVGQIERFEETSDTHGGGAPDSLAGQIADLGRSVPEAHRVGRGGGGGSSGAGGGGSAGSSGGGSAGSSDGGGSGDTDGGNGGATATAASSAAPAAAKPAASTTPPFRPESAGVIALAGKWFALEGARSQLSDTVKQTDALLKESNLVRGTVAADARALANANLTAVPTDPTQLMQAQAQFEAAATHFKQLSTLLVPLGEQAITIEGARSVLLEWRNSLTAKDETIARYLALRLGFLLGSVAVVLIISDVWRRATFRYLHDGRRRQQFLALRRVAVGLALTLVLVFGLVSEVGSLATYAGLITAGLAVALQNVILAVVAYFFLIGRYGVRVGDRVTLAGVTGRVVEIGLIRIYLMELTGPELRSSGRMVVLSNAVLFQPTALFKQMPGGDYFWHTITLTLAATADVAVAEKRLTEAADSVYQNYRPAIEQQHAALQRFIDFETAMPKPEVYVRLTDKGLECTVRYPVEPARAAAIDQKMIVALREAQSKAPDLQVVAGPFLTTSEN